MTECRCKLPPEVTFERREDGAMLFAEPPGARIMIRWLDEARASVTIADRRKSDLAEVPSEPIANFEAQLRPKSESIQQEATELACAVYWSWWRALLIKGEAPGEEDIEVARMELQKVAKEWEERKDLEEGSSKHHQLQAKVGPLISREEYAQLKAELGKEEFPTREEAIRNAGEKWGESPLKRMLKFFRQADIIEGKKEELKCQRNVIVETSRMKER
jgi:hypothetical protein